MAFLLCVSSVLILHVKGISITSLNHTLHTKSVPGLKTDLEKLNGCLRTGLLHTPMENHFLREHLGKNINCFHNIKLLGCYRYEMMNN